MLPSMTMQVSGTGIGTMACSCFNAILLFTSLFSSAIYAAPTVSNSEVQSTTQHHTQFWDLLHHSEDLYNLHHPIYNQYRLQRLQSSDLVLETMRINGFPNFRALSPRERINLGTNDLTITDREFLNLLLTAMRHVHTDEVLYPGADTTGFLQDFSDIVNELESLMDKLDQWIGLNDITGTNHLIIEEELLWPQVQEFERTLHALYILQEMDSFIPHFRADFTRLFYFHSQHEQVKRR